VNTTNRIIGEVLRITERFQTFLNRAKNKI